MEKPRWRVRASTYLVDSPHMRLRSDEVELPDGTVVPNYYVRESHGFAAILALTPDENAVLVRQYRYGSDAIHLELPAGMLAEHEDPRDCAMRELLEETGYAVGRCEPVAEFLAEPVRSTSRAYVYLGTDARKVAEPALDATEHLEVELVTLAELRALLAEGRIDAAASIAAAYRALEHLKRL